MRQRTSKDKYILIFDSSTLIVLRELEFIEILDRIREKGIAKILIPKSVREEFINAGINLDVDNDNISLSKNIEPLCEIIPPSLGKGELGAITIAYNLARTHTRKYIPIVITDDQKARKTCKKIGLKAFGTLGLIIFAEKHGLITKEEAINLLEKIPNTSLYITSELLQEAINKIKNNQ